MFAHCEAHWLVCSVHSNLSTRWIVFTLICLRSYGRMHARSRIYVHVYKAFIAIGRSKQTNKHTKKSVELCTPFKYKPNIKIISHFYCHFFFCSCCVCVCSALCCVELVYRFGKYVLNNSLHEVAATAAAVVAVAIKCVIYLCMHSHSALPKLQLFYTSTLAHKHSI